MNNTKNITRLLTLTFACSAIALTMGAGGGHHGHGHGHGGHGHGGHGHGGHGHHGGGHFDKPRTDFELGDPIPGLTEEEEDLFFFGKGLFEKDFTPSEGLGPLYNARSCVLCHGFPVTGGSQGSTDDNVIHFGGHVQDRFFPMLEIGGPTEGKISIAGDPEAPLCTMAPEDGLATAAALGPVGTVSIRHTPAVFGFGLVDAIPDHEILGNQADDDRGWGVAGFVNGGVEMESLDTNQAWIIFERTQPYGAARAGRFGWKSQTGTLFQFSTEPTNIELGITSPFFRTENTPDGLPMPPECDVANHAINDVDGEITLGFFYFQAFIAPPPVPKLDKKGKKGKKVFKQIGCTSCHRESYRTTKDYYVPWPDGTAHRVDALSNKKFSPFSDFLVHDMGPALTDGRQMGRASGAFWRTTPLWGISTKTNFLHDGSVTTIDDAIMAHDGEGAATRDAYDALPQYKKNRLLHFLGQL